MAKIGAGTAIAESFGFLPEGWRRAAGAMCILVAITVILQAVKVLPQPTAGLVTLAVLPFQMAASVMATGALYRVELARDHAGDPVFGVGQGGLQWGQVEWRVLAAGLVVGLILGLVAVGVLVIWGIVLGAMSAAGAFDLSVLQRVQGGGQAALAAVGELFAGPAGWATAAVILPGVALLSYLGARLSLLAVRSADTQSFNLGAAWSATKGATGAIILASIVFYLATMLAGILGGAFGGIVGAFVGGVTHSGIVAYVRLFGGVVGAGLGAALATPLWAGLATFVYRTQRGKVSLADQFS
jgi:hypothetical protein